MYGSCLLLPHVASTLPRALTLVKNTPPLLISVSIPKTPDITLLQPNFSLKYRLRRPIYTQAQNWSLNCIVSGVDFRTSKFFATPTLYIPTQLQTLPLLDIIFLFQNPFIHLRPSQATRTASARKSHASSEVPALDQTHLS
ncbi:hypothetical protein ACMFMG_009871 [Clarireedia jacksonii]